MRRDTIQCSKLDCQNSHTEEVFNQGHIGWGDITGIIDEHGEKPHLCPECMAKIKEFLNGKLD